jgi:hypothetical protein
LTEIPLAGERRFHDQTPMDQATVERILRSISFIGPAMNQTRFAALRARVQALPEAPVWARTFVLRSGRRALSRGGELHRSAHDVRGPVAAAAAGRYADRFR